MLAGKKLGPFQVEHELGSGAMGTVYKGVESKTGKLVAIKIISIGLSGNERALERFLREVNVLKKLKHPNIARYLGSGRYHGTPFYIMEFIDGESLDKLLERRGRLPWEDVADWGAQLCAGLHYAHMQGIIHRDLKPSNVMLLKDGTVKLTDFGIAKDAEAAGLTATHSTVGTAAYMSPEQCRGAKDITFKSDLYSLGVMFYELVTGHKPFDADNPMDIFQMHVRGKCARPSTYVMELPIWFDTLILHLMAKTPDERPLDAAMVSKELESIEKRVSEQKSAAVERVTKRRADRTTFDAKLDDTDKEVARVLLGKKKRKTKTQPFYTKNWFTATALGTLLVLLLIGGYVLFIKAPSADSLYREAETKMTRGTLDDHREAAREPIRLFLVHYPDDPRVEKVRGWRDQAELETCLDYVRREVKGPDDPSAGWSAVVAERDGRLDDAIQSWQRVTPLKTDADPDRRGWGLLAEKSLKSLRESEEIQKNLTARLAKKDKKDDKAALSDPERLTLDVLAAMADDDRRAALLAVDELRRFTENVDTHRAYWLLSLKLKRELQLQ